MAIDDSEVLFRTPKMFMKDNDITQDETHETLYAFNQMSKL